MKNSIFASLIVIFMISSSITAQENPDYLYNALLSTKAPTIDGVLEADFWENVPIEPVQAIYNDFDDPVVDEYDFSVWFKMTWLNENLYIYMAVLDDILVDDESLATWQWDNIEIYFDGDNSDGEGAYDGINDIQLRWTYDEADRDDGIDVGYGNGLDWGFDPAVFEWDISVTDSGYNLELAVPYEEFEISPEAEFGFEVQVGDNDPDESRVFYRWNWNGAGSYMQTLNHGTIILVQDQVPETAVENNRGDQKVSPFALVQNYPNPFNPRTTISYSLATKSMVTLEIYNVAGERVAVLEHNSVKTSGRYAVDFYAGDLPSGIYFYKLSTNDFRFTGKMVLAR